MAGAATAAGASAATLALAELQVKPVLSKPRGYHARHRRPKSPCTLSDFFRRHGSKLSLVAAIGLVLTTFTFKEASPAQAATTSFAAEFGPTYANGSVVTIGNTVLQCPTTGTVSGTSCATAQAGTALSTGSSSALNNNQWQMTNLNVAPSSLSGQANSSTSDLDLPAGATVLWAGLYWGARTTAGTGGTAAVGSPSQMSFRVPGGSYTSISASKHWAPSGQTGNPYQSFADVTNMVKAAGNGTYAGANIAAGLGLDRYGGWALTVAYTAPGMPLANISVFDGFAEVAEGAPQNVEVCGFQAPPAGPVDAYITAVAYEGDAGTTGDKATLQTTAPTANSPFGLGDNTSPVSNYFSAAIDNANGNYKTDRNPAWKNVMGFDIRNQSVTGAITNNATCAQFAFTSSGDTYYPGVLGLVIDVYAPLWDATKAVTNLSGGSPAQPGDILQYSITYVNNGQDASDNTIIKDAIPAGTTYVAGSLKATQTGGSLGSTVQTLATSDASGDDAGSVTGSQVQVNVGTGAGNAPSGSGGTMACTQGAQGSFTGCQNVGPTKATVTFQVKVGASGASTCNPAVTGAGTCVLNQSTISYTSHSTQTAGTASSNEVVTPLVPIADVSIAKALIPAAEANLSPVNSCTNPANSGADTTSCPTMVTPNGPGNVAVGSPVSATLVVKNAGPNSAGNVVVTDTVPPGWLNVTVPAPCTPSGSLQPGVTFTCNFGTQASGWQTTLTLHGQTDPNQSSPLQPLSNTAQVSTTSFDPNTTNNTSTDTLNLNQQADLHVTKTAAAADPSCGLAAGCPIVWTVTMSNTGPSTAMNPIMSDILADVNFGQVTVGVPSASVSPETAAPGASCDSYTAGRGITCSAASLAPGGTVTYTIPGTLAANLPAGTTITNTATVSSRTQDNTPTQSDANGNPICGLNGAIGNNCATSDLTTTDPVANLTAAKTASPNPVQAGQPVTYTITVTNTGPSDATNVSIADQLEMDDTHYAASPEPVVSNSRVGNGGTSTSVPTAGADGATGRNITCSTPTLPVGQSMVCTITATTAPNATSLTNVATITNPSGPSVPDVTAPPVTVVPTYDLGIAKTVNVDTLPGVAGEAVVYTVTITNYGPSDAKDVVFRDSVPDGLTVQSVTTDADGWTCPTDPGANFDCTHPDSFPVGATATFTVSTLSDDDLCQADVTEDEDGNEVIGDCTANTAGITESASVSADSPEEFNPGNNNTSVTLNGMGAIDLSLTKCGVALGDCLDADGNKIVDQSDADAGTQGTFLFTVTNNSDSLTADSPLFTDVLPKGVGLVSADAPLTDCTTTLQDDGTTILSCTVSQTLAPGASSDPLPVTVTYPPDMAAGMVIDTGHIDINHAIDSYTDTNQANNADSWKVVLAQNPDVVTTVTIGTPGDPGQCNAEPDTSPSGTTATTTGAVAWDPTLPGALNSSDPAYTGPGSERQVNLTLTNAGPSTANNVVFRLTRTTDAVALLDQAVVTVTDADGNTTDVPLGADGLAPYCATSDTEVNCYLANLGLGSLAPGQTVTIHYPIQLASYDQPGKYPDTQNISASNEQPANQFVTAAGSNQDTAPICIGNPETDLSVAKQNANTVGNPWTPPGTMPPAPGSATDLPATAPQAFIAGSNFTYTFTVQAGAGSADAINAMLSDTLPPGLTAESVSASRGTCAITNPAGTVAVPVTLAANPATPPGYTANSSDDAATTDLSGFTCDLGTVKATSASDAAGDQVGDSITVTVNGVVAPDANDMYINADGTSGDNWAISVPNFGTVTSDTPLLDGQPSALSNNAPTDIYESADLQVSKLWDDAPASGESQITAGADQGFTLTVTNTGVSSVEHAVLTDLLPPGFTVDLTDPANSACDTGLTSDDYNAIPNVDNQDGTGSVGVDPESNTPATAATKLACYVGALAPGQTVSIPLVADTDPTVLNSLTGTEQVNTAVIGSLAYDPDGTNNVATAPILVVPGTIDLTVAKTNLELDSDHTANPLTVIAGSRGRYLITATNLNATNNPLTATAPVVTDTLPAGVTFVSAGAPATNCATSAGSAGTTEVKCTLPDLAPGQSASFPISVKFSPDLTPADGLAVNAAHVALSPDSPYTEITLTNNDATAETVVNRLSDTSIVKTIKTAEPIKTGQVVTYRLVEHNAGPSVAQHVTVSDAVPAGMTYVATKIVQGGSGEQGCQPPQDDDENHILRCQVGVLQVGESAVVEVQFQVNDDMAGKRICNTALVGANGLDPHMPNNQSEVCLTPVRQTAARPTPTPTPTPPGTPAPPVSPPPAPTPAPAPTPTPEFTLTGSDLQLGVLIAAVGFLVLAALLRRREVHLMRR